MSSPRRQCRKCPWKVGSKPRSIPYGYCATKHRALQQTIASPGVLEVHGPLRMMACHETKPGDDLPCVGWLVNQLGPGNNLLLRLAVIRGHVDANVELDGPQHPTLQDTLP